MSVLPVWCGIIVFYFLMGQFLSPFLPPATKLGQGYVFTRVSDSVHRGVCLSACWDTDPPEQTPSRRRHTPPQEQTPPGPGTPWGQTPPQEQTPPGPGTPVEHSMLGDTVNERAVRILLECNLVKGDGSVA